MNLSYSGQIRLEDSIATQSKDMIDALLTADSDKTVLKVDSGQIRPRGDHAVVLVSVSASGPIETLEAVRDELAQGIVNLGLEESLTEAQDAINISA